MLKRNLIIAVTGIVIIVLIVIIASGKGNNAVLTEDSEEVQTVNTYVDESETTVSESYDASYTVAEADRISEFLSEAAPAEWYGGTYYSDHHQIIILLCEDTEDNESTIRQLVDNEMTITDWDVICFEECAYSLSCLNDIKSVVEDSFSDIVDDIYVNQKNNYVFIMIEELDEEIEEEIRTFLEEEISDFSKDDASVLFMNQGVDG